MKLPNDFEEDLAKLPGLTAVGTALALFAAEIGKLDAYERDSKGRWVGRPNNFVTFKVQWPRAGNIAVTVRGYSTEFRIDPDTRQVTKPPLELKSDRGGPYTKFAVSNASQLAASAAYIAQALEIATERGGLPRRT